MKKRPATEKARDRLAKLEALADPARGGTPSECAAAAAKVARLKRTFDFTGLPEPTTHDMFKEARSFRRGSQALFVAALERHEMEIGSCVKWAIEVSSPIHCVFTGDTLRAEADGRTAAKLQDIASAIIGAYRAVLHKFDAIDGVTTADRSAFLRGLTDGMLGETRPDGQRLPSRRCRRISQRPAKRQAVATAPRLSVHPYSLAWPLGRQIRFSATIEEIVADLDRKIHPQLSPQTKQVHEK